MLNTESSLVVRACAVCQKPLKKDADFCSVCGNTSESGAAIAIAQKITHESYEDHFSLHWGELKIVAALFGIFLLSSFILGTVSRFNTTPWPTTITIGIAAITICLFVAARYSDILPLFAMPKLSPSQIIRLAGYSLVFVVFMIAYFTLLRYSGVPTLRAVDIYQKNGWPIWSIFLSISVMPAIFEELAFRGVIQTRLGRVFSEREAWLIQAALFSVLHLVPFIFPSHFVMGLFLGYLRLRSKSLYPSMMLHGTWNALVLCEEIYWM